MQYKQLGKQAGISVSRLCLGTMNFGELNNGHHAYWSKDLQQSRQLIKKAIDLGINYFDCANVYGFGASERVLGTILKEFLTRDQYILTSKVAYPIEKGPNQRGLSRKHIFESVDASLKRLGLDYIDKLVIHRHPHAIPDTVPSPLIETIHALHDLVKAGKVLYLGASSMFAWQFVELQMLTEKHNLTPFISMQNHYNLIYREEEREMNPYCIQKGVALTPWSPLARGFLAGTYNGSIKNGSTKRSKGKDQVRTEALYKGKNSFKILKRVEKVALKHEKTIAQISLAWLLNKPGVISPVIGVSQPEQLDELVDALNIKLSQKEINFLEALYLPLDNLLSHGFS